MTVTRLRPVLLIVAVVSVAACKEDPLRTVACKENPIDIVLQPRSVTVDRGTQAVFNVDVSSCGTVTIAVGWQTCSPGIDLAMCGWAFAGNGDAPAGPDDHFSLVIPSAQSADSGRHYRAIVGTKGNADLSHGYFLRASDAAELTVLPPPPLPSVVFTDSTFSDASWTVTTYLDGNGGTVSAVQVAAGGNPGPHRSVTLQVNAGPPGARSDVFSFHWAGGAVYDPTVSGSIASVDYAEDYLGPGQATGLVVRQDGNVYYASPSYQVTTPSTTWTHITHAGMAASDFVLLAPDLTTSSQHPDFSATGKPIEFGFLRANSTGVGAAGYTTTVGIDNWLVTVRRNP